MALEYDKLKAVYKVKSKSETLFDYLLENNDFDKNRIFHQLSKEQLIDDYIALTKKHLELLQNL